MNTVVLYAIDEPIVQALLERKLGGRGDSVQWVDLTSLEFGAWMGCAACSKAGRCIQDDAMTSIVAGLHTCHRLILGTPIFLGVHHPLLKRAIDRFLPLAGDQFAVRHREMHHASRMASPFSLLGIGWIAEYAMEEAQTFKQLIERHAVNLDCPHAETVLISESVIAQAELMEALRKTERAS